jgi:cystathionine beta-lyase/cystathionine gamma-synthase
MTETPQPGENTRAVHLPPPRSLGQVPMAPPVWRATTYAFETSQEYADVLGDRVPGYTYSRVDNPTSDGFADAVASLEGARIGGITGQAFGSGMAAITAVLMTYAHAGAHVVAPSAIYGGTYGLLTDLLSRFGIESDFVDGTDVAQVRAAIRPTTRLVWAETLANPTMAVADLPALAEAAHEAGALLVVDSTLATPVVCRPLEHGADLVIHSATKYIGGHSDATGGVVVGRPGVVGPVRAVRIHTGGMLAPDEAFLLRRGLETLPLRVRRQCDTAALLAASIARHPGVARVDYPGLPEHPGHETARRLFDSGPEGTRFGAIVTITPHGGREAGMALADRLRLVRVATSLGGTHTLAGHAASTTHRQLDGPALAAAGIDAGAVRFSVGLEDADDLILDVTNALNAERRPQGPDRAFVPYAGDGR